MCLLYIYRVHKYFVEFGFKATRAATKAADATKAANSKKVE
jgi:hypothetical protein